MRNDNKKKNRKKKRGRKYFECDPLNIYIYNIGKEREGEIYFKK